MSRENMTDLLAFIAVARERSFTRAAAQLGVSQSALSQTIRSFETRLGVTLLTRTTRSVAPTEAGERLLTIAEPRFSEVEAELAAVAELRDRPSGKIRITTTDYVADYILWPKLGPFLKNYPDVQIELSIDYGLTDIVAEGFDLGVRLGDEVAKDMIAVRISPDLRFYVVGSPDYFATRPLPRQPEDLVDHRCIGLRLPTRGGVYAWELHNGDREVRVRVEGQLVCNTLNQVVQGSLHGVGLAHLPEEAARAHVSSGALIRVMDDWSPRFAGFHIYYPRRQTSRAISLLVEALRLRIDL